MKLTQLYGLFLSFVAVSVHAIYHAEKGRSKRVGFNEPPQARVSFPDRTCLEAVEDCCCNKIICPCCEASVCCLWKTYKIWQRVCPKDRKDTSQKRANASVSSMK